MAQTNYTPISLYYSTTASAVPTAANLVPGELAINTADGKLYYEDSSGVVQVLATKSTGSIGGSNTQVQFNNSGSLGGSSGLTWDGSFLTTSSIKNSALTSGRVTYAGASGLLSDSATLTYDGTSLTTPRLVLGGTTLPSAGTATLFSRTSDNNTYLQTGSGNNFNLLDGSQNTMATFSPTALNFNISNTERMRLNSTGLGIGTSSPDSFTTFPSKLVVGSGTGNQQITIYSGTTSEGNLIFADGTTGTQQYMGLLRYDHADNAMKFYTNGGTLGMTQDSSGNLGLGVTPSAWSSGYKALQLGTNTSLAGNTGGSVAILSSNAYFDGSNYVRITADSSALYQMATGSHNWRIAGSGSAGSTVSFTQAMTLNASGDLIVGGNTVVYDLAGRRVITINGASQAALGFTVNAVDKGILIHTGTDMIMSNSVAGAITFQTTNTERMRIDSSGLLLQGSTSATFTMPSTGGASFKASTTAGGSPIVEIGNTDTTTGSDGSPALMVFKGSTTTGSNARFIQFSANGSGTTMGAIVGVASGLCAFANFSDISLKKNIQPLAGSLSKIIALKPSSFDMISDNGHVNAGFIAQDVQKVYPEYVIENMANEGEKPLMAITGGMSGGFIAELVKAIQELKAEFDAYKATHP